jgi:TatD DNase family protein
VHATAGLHPHEARFGVGTIVDLVGRPGVVAVGEAGLDYHYDHSPRDDQRTAFAAQIQLAHQHRLPLVIHTREAWDDTFDVLGAEGTPEHTVFHCFTGGVDELRRCLDLGAFVSFSGIVSFPGATDVRAAAAECPADRILVETDSPYLAPVPHRGRRNHPAWVTDVGTAVATLRGCSTTEVASVTSANARLAFPAIGS